MSKIVNLIDYKKRAFSKEYEKALIAYYGLSKQTREQIKQQENNK